MTNRLINRSTKTITIPMPDDSRIPGRNAEDMALDGSVLTTKR